MKLGKEEILNRLRRYCAYRERSELEVKEKLKSFGVFSTSHEWYISELQEENFLSEERFAESYALGKFRSNGWGKVRIKLGLRQKGVTGAIADAALASIPDSEYGPRALALGKAKWMGVDKVQDRYLKTYAYLMRKGYETDLVKATLLRLKELKVESEEI